MIDDLRFDNRFTKSLPADSDIGTERRQVEQACYSRVKPAVVTEPRLIAHSAEMFELLGLESAEIDRPGFVEVLAGNRLLAGMDPHAACYGGHQFGNWAGQLHSCNR